MVTFLMVSLTVTASETHMQAVGTWVVDQQGQTMLDPQTSGLLAVDNRLYSISDAAAEISQQHKLHVIDPASATITHQLPIMGYSNEIKSSCFFEYLSSRPDYEAMVKYPFDNDKWIWVTEDASLLGPMTEACQQRFQHTGSTAFPTLLVLVHQHANGLTLERVRPIQFPVESDVGDAPNDGIEGLSVTRDNRLLLGLEKDNIGNARIFSVGLDEKTFEIEDFLRVEDAGMPLPSFESGNHPINGMDVFYPNEDQGFLIAIARNDNELWIIDLNNNLPVRRQKFEFMAPAAGGDCVKPYAMNNVSIEGVAVSGRRLFLLNDPWKVNYHKNIQCDGDRAAYERQSPLLFEIPLEQLGL